MKYRTMCVLVGFSVVLGFAALYVSAQAVYDTQRGSVVVNGVPQTDFDPSNFLTNGAPGTSTNLSDYNNDAGFVTASVVSGKVDNLNGFATNLTTDGTMLGLIAINAQGSVILGGAGDNSIDSGSFWGAIISGSDNHMYNSQRCFIMGEGCVVTNGGWYNLVGGDGIYTDNGRYNLMWGSLIRHTNCLNASLVIGESHLIDFLSGGVFENSVIIGDSHRLLADFIGSPSNGVCLFGVTIANTNFGNVFAFDTEDGYLNIPMGDVVYMRAANGYYFTLGPTISDSLVVGTTVDDLLGVVTVVDGVTSTNVMAVAGNIVPTYGGATLGTLADPFHSIFVQDASIYYVGTTTSEFAIVGGNVVVVADPFGGSPSTSVVAYVNTPGSGTSTNLSDYNNDPGFLTPSDLLTNAVSSGSTTITGLTNTVTFDVAYTAVPEVMLTPAGAAWNQVVSIERLTVTTNGFTFRVRGGAGLITNAWDVAWVASPGTATAAVVVGQASASIYGYINGCWPVYSNGTSVTITNGDGFFPSGEYFAITQAITHALNEIPVGEDLIYIYLDYSASTLPYTIAVYDSTNEPVKHMPTASWVNSTSRSDRVLGVVMTTNGVTTIKNYIHSGVLILLDQDADNPATGYNDVTLRLASDMNPDGAWQVPNIREANVLLPVNAIAGYFGIQAQDAGSSCLAVAASLEGATMGFGYIAGVGSAHTTLSIEGYNRMITVGRVPLGASRNVRIRGSGNDDNKLSLWLAGWEIER